MKRDRETERERGRETNQPKLFDAHSRCSGGLRGRQTGTRRSVFAFTCVPHLQLFLDVLKKIFNFVLGPPSPGGSRGRVRTAVF